jgi:23S rRNA (pseudouridine1915-N3)-methyltransferase
MKTLSFLWIGSLKKAWWREACEHYAKRLGRFHSINETVLKDAPGKLPEQERRRHEGARILEKLSPGDFAVVLDESGTQLGSRELAERLRTWIEDPGRAPCFVIGGAFGISDEVLQRADFAWSLGKLTLPHELARVVLLEQIYRASTILAGAPYHH